MHSSAPMRIAHISDLHFSKVTLHPRQFFSKRWVGNVNLLLRRRNEFHQDKLLDLIQTFQKEKVQHVLISGDLTCTTLQEELREARRFIDLLKGAGLSVLTIPGNHDHYTKSDYAKKLFYDFFPSSFGYEASPYNLKEHKIAVKKLGEGWWIILLDTALATSYFSCHGVFSLQIQKNLADALTAIPKADKVLVANHFPLFTYDSHPKHLRGDDALRDMLAKYKQIKMYVHGHMHRHCIADLRNAGLPVIIDSGSAAHTERASCNLYTLQPNGVTIQPLFWKKEEDSTFSWQPAPEHSLTW